MHATSCGAHGVGRSGVLPDRRDLHRDHRDADHRDHLHRGHRGADHRDHPGAARNRDVSRVHRDQRDVSHRVRDEIRGRDVSRVRDGIRDEHPDRMVRHRDHPDHDRSAAAGWDGRTVTTVDHRQAAAG